MKVNVLVGRMSPMHYGHIRLIKQMTTDNDSKNIIFLGSSNSPLSFRNIFSYNERKYFLNKIIPENIHILPIADMSDDRHWKECLYDTLKLIAEPEEITFYTGSEKDIYYFELHRNSKIVIVDREEINNISSTQLRNIMLKDLVNQNALENNKNIYFDYGLYIDYIPREIFKQALIIFRDNYLKLMMRGEEKC
jgi:nicotinic acid mononucleotide adenylyltransferase